MHKCSLLTFKEKAYDPKIFNCSVISVQTGIRDRTNRSARPVFFPQHKKHYLLMAEVITGGIRGRGHSHSKKHFI